MKRYLKQAFSLPVVITALKVALLVGTLLAIINHFSAITAYTLTKQNILQIALSYCVPYAVSTYSSVKFIRLAELSRCGE